MSGEKPGRLSLPATPELDRLRAEMEAERRPPPPAAPIRPQRKKPAPAGPAPAGAAPRAMAPAGRGRPRTGARVAAVQALYQSEYTGESAETVIAQFLRHRIGAAAGAGGYEDGHVPEADAPLFGTIVRRAAKHGEAVDTVVAAHLDADWPLGKLDPVLRALLRAACAELREGREPPAKVVINEYLDIAHGFFGGEEPRFANGVLDAMARALRPGEFAPPRPGEFGDRR
jgi:N utilization substance protein B